MVIRPARNLYDQFGQRTYHEGLHAKFNGGLLETEDQEVIDFLMNSPRKGIDYIVFNNGEADAEVSEEGKKEVEKEKEALATTIHSCPKCPFKAKNELGLKAHIRAKHPAEE